MEKVKKSEVKLMSDNIAVRPITQEEQVTDAGIIVPTNKFEPIQWGEVISVGPGWLADNGKIVPTIVAENDKVLYHINNGASANR